MSVNNCKLAEIGCYVYIYFDAKGVPFYVGCGIKDRAERWRSKSKLKQLRDKVEQTINLIGEVPVVKIIENTTRENGLSIEKQLIRAIGIAPHGPLLNSKHGRSGIGGAVPSAETRNLIASAAKRQWNDLNFREKYSRTRKSRPLHPLSAFNIAEANRRRRGIKLTKETKLKMSQARKNWWQKKRDKTS